MGRRRLRLEEWGEWIWGIKLLGEKDGCLLFLFFVIFDF